MPQIEEAQFVNWGSMRPDIIPLAAPGITMAVGPNGSGKSCWLDGLKIILGVSDLSGRRTPASYIFNGGPSGVPAEQAWLRATFANPVHTGQRHRVFAYAQNGCDRAEHVTVVCRIRGDRRQYVVLPGRIAWGVGTSIDADLTALEKRIPEAKWLGPQRYDRLLTRAGVTKALRGVLALPQGETNRLVAEAPTGLMRRLLELTGRQDTLDKFRLARTKHNEAVTAHRDAQRQLELKRIDVGRLELQVRKHREFVRDRSRMVNIEEQLLPAALHHECMESLAHIKSLVTARETAQRQRRTELTDLHDECGRLSQDLDYAEAEVEAVRNRRATLASELSEAHQLYGESRERAAAAWRTLEAARSAAGSISMIQVTRNLELAELAFSAALHRRHYLASEILQLRSEKERINVGGSLAPPEVRAFQQLLRSSGVHAEIAGDVLAETADGDDQGSHAQAALGDALWALVVPTDDYAAACDLATQSRYTWPLALEGIGTPRGVLDLSVSQGLGRLLEALDAVAGANSQRIEELRSAGITGTTRDGMRHEPALSRLTSVRDEVLHPQARVRAVARLDSAIAEAAREQDALEPELQQLRADLIGAYRVRDLLRQLEDARKEFRTAGRELANVCLGRRLLQALHEKAAATEKSAVGRVDETKSAIAVQKVRIATAAQTISNFDNELRILADKRLEQELLLADRPLPDGFDRAVLGSLQPAANLDAEHDQLRRAIEDLERYPADVKDPVIIEQLESEQNRLEAVAELINGKDKELGDRAQIVEAARKQYDDHIRALVRELKNKFVEICATAGIEGSIALIPGDLQDEYGVDVLVSHKVGEPMLSYRDGSHSGGQGTKIAILLLLAAMSLGQNADLLIVDEHKAHLDGTNSSQITDIMRSLAGRVQFVLSAPTVPRRDAADADWCDVQVTFLPRDPGETHSPPARLMSWLDAAHLERRFESLQQPLT